MFYYLVNLIVSYSLSCFCLLQVSYSLTQLAKSQLNKDRKEINPHDIPQMFQSSGSLTELVSPKYSGIVLDVVSVVEVTDTSFLIL